MDHHAVGPGGALDETYDRFRSTGPEFEGWLSNHGPMAADALLRIGAREELPRWVAGYARRLDEAPAPRWTIAEEEWREVLGDPSRLGDWIALFERELRDRPWREVLVRWWPRLLDGAVASATHPLIRTGHVVRALLDGPTDPRLHELAHALGYWAARHRRLPAHVRPAGDAGPGAALDAATPIATGGGIRTRLDDLARARTWSSTVARLRAAPGPDAVPAALDDLVDAAVTRYGRWAHGNPVMLVHAATAPRAAGLVLPALPRSLWVATYETAWAAAAAITTIYRPRVPAPAAPSPWTPSPDEVVEHAVATGDEHAIKLAEVALESHARGNPDALPSALRASDLIG